MAQRQEYEKMYIAMILFAVVILMGNIYYYCHPLLHGAGLTAPPVDYLMKRFHGAGLFSTPLKTKGAAMLLLMLCSVIASTR